MRSVVQFAFVCVLSVVSVSALEFSHSTREEDVAFLEELTSPMRGQVVNGGSTSLVDFLASSVGLQFLETHRNDLYSQGKLELDYRRNAICANLKTSQKRGSLTSEDITFQNCVCTPTIPYLHCLAIGSQLFIARGYTKSQFIMESPWTGSSLKKYQTRRALFSEESASGNADDDEATDPGRCIPHMLGSDEQLCYGGDCNVPVGKILDIKIHDMICTGDREVTSINMENCNVCIPSRRSEPCHKICRDDMRLVERLFETASANLDVDVCVDLGRIGSLFKYVFGGDNCFQGSIMELYFYQRVLKLNVNQGHSSLKLRTGLEYKYSDGPNCLCDLNNFRCAKSCKLQEEDVIGSLTFDWDFFFASGTYTRSWNEPKKCYTEFQHDPPICSKGNSKLFSKN